ncbi:MAG: putative DNA-binding domain-containing protein [Chlamydiota bacterium]
MFHKELQGWFGEVLRTPLENQKMSSEHILSSAKYVVGTTLMKPHERVEIYNQQYWWRLFSAIQHVFPSLTKWMGVLQFNQQIAEPYLLAHNPSQWSLYLIAEGLIEWMSPLKRDKTVLKLAYIDKAFYDTFLGEVVVKPLDPSKSFILQSHVKLLSLKEDLVTFRKEILEDKNPPKPSKEPIKVVLYRVPLSGKTFWQPLSDIEYGLLEAFQGGAILEEALSFIEGEKDIDIAAIFNLFTSLRLIQNAAP